MTNKLRKVQVQQQNQSAMWARRWRRLATPSSVRFARLREERGVAMVEFALVASTLMLIVLGILFFGRFLNYSIDQTHLANVGARWAAVNVDPNAQPGYAGPACASLSLQQCVQLQADSGELKNGSKDVTNTTGTAAQGAQVCITFPNGTSQVGDPVKVAVTANFHFLPVFGIGTISVPESATMRLEAVPTHYSAGCYP